MPYALVYSIADKYRVAGLKETAGNNFFYTLQNSYCRGSVSPKVFAQVTRKVFESTPESDSGLRDPILNYAAKHIDQLMSNKRFKAHTDKIEGFWGQLVEISVARKERERCCPICAEK
ncbi:hypothetical protein IWX90DRAFT_570 [Phyllosticta citrichinensis]|uniref:Uncharacterized protein n=1 Tax=Phyllosticta citrichinensis TaxID=1130410 RepID=A0ABR1Y572_9PEZI